MGRSLFLACGLFLILGSSACADRMSRIRDAYQSVVVVYANVTDEMGNTVDDAPICSGFVIKNDNYTMRIMTARHCVATSKPTHIEFRDGEVVPVASYKYAQLSDSAIIVVKTKHRHPALQTTKYLEAGEQLYVLGMPDGDSWSFSSAYSRNGDKDMMDSGMLFYAIECGSCYLGDSGGPVIDDQEHVVGIISRGGGADPGVTYITPAELFHEIL